MGVWKLYNHAIVPDCAPHEVPDISRLEDGSVWKAEGKRAVLARWTSHYGQEQGQWWYVVKDSPFYLSELRSKHRSMISKGIRLFEVKQVDPMVYMDEIYELMVEAWKAYPRAYRPNVDKATYIDRIEKEKDLPYELRTYAAFHRETGRLGAFAKVQVHEKYMDLQNLKALPAFERLQVNAALMCGVLEALEEQLKAGCYICDGARNIVHKTGFQDYLEKYFGFRKVYCKLHVIYNPQIKLLIKVLYPFRRLIAKMGRFRIISLVSGVLKMDEIVRSQENE